MLTNRNTYFRATVFVALIFIIISSVYGQRRTKFDYRCLWVVRNALISERTIDDAINFADRYGFNNLIVQVRGRGDALYQSNIVPRSAILKDDSFDPLALIIKKAHAKGIKVHAWVNVYLLWSAKSDPYSDEHIFNAHPDWIDHNGQNGNNKADRERIKPTGDEGVYLAPHHPEVTPYLLSVFRELVAKYDLDGLHLDYVRYKDADYGNNRAALEYYKKSGGGEPLALLSTVWSKADSVTQFTNKLVKWSDYRRQAITDLVKKTKEMVLEVRPDCIVSAAVKPNLYDARNRFFQEWDVWLAAGYVDWVFPMNYAVSLRSFAANIDIIYDNLPPKYRDRIIMGIATYNQSAFDVADKIKYTRVTRFRGVSLFSYNVLKDNPRYLYPLRRVLLP